MFSRKNKDKSKDRSERTKTKSKKVKKIYTPRPGLDQEDSDDDHKCELDENAPQWAKHFSKKELMGRYEPVRELGRGSYGLVYEGKALKNNRYGMKKDQKVAIKKVKRVFHTETDAKRLLREIRILRLLQSHECIVSLFDILPPLDPNGFLHLTLIFEFVDADLGKIFRTNQFFSTLHVQYMLYQILLGMAFMHSAGIVHRDIKPANILINEDCSIKICDFGLARGFNEDTSVKVETNTQAEAPKEDRKSKRKKGMLRRPKKNKNGESSENGSKKKVSRAVTRHVVTRWYRAPEVILLQQRKEFITAVDVWSIGCIFAELLQMQKDNSPDPSRRAPIFPGDSCFPLSVKDQFDYASRLDQMQVIFDIIGTPTEEEIEKITDPKARKYLYGLPLKKQRNLRKKYPGCPPEGIDLMLRLLQFDVEKRYSVHQALEHPYLEQVRDIANEKFNTKKHTFKFEDTQLDMKSLRALILNEALQYNPEVKEAYIESGAMKHLPKV